jgi:G3E family GTPase
VLRAKGVFKTEAAHPRILQAVRQTYELTDAELQGPASQPGAADNRLVLIGRGLDAARLDETFRECLLDADRD